MNKKQSNRKELITSQIYRNSKYGKIEMILDIGKNHTIHNLSQKHINKLLSYKLRTLDFSSSIFKLEDASFLNEGFHSLKEYVFYLFRNLKLIIYI